MPAGPSIGSPRRRRDPSPDELKLSSLRRSYLRYSYGILLKRSITEDELDGRGEVLARDVAGQLLELLVRAGLDIAILEPPPGGADGSGKMYPMVIVVSAERPLNAKYAGALRKGDSTRNLLVITAEGASGGDAKETLRHNLTGTVSPLLQNEHDRLHAERYLKVRKVGVHNPPRLTPSMLTEAKRLMLTRRIIYRQVDRLTETLRGRASAQKQEEGAEHNAWTYVEECFPLHDDHWNNIFLAKYQSTVFSKATWLAAADSDVVTTRVRSHNLTSLGFTEEEVIRTEQSPPVSYLGCDFLIEQVQAATADDLQPDVFVSDWHIQALREHLGERAAFYFAFNSYYAAWLIPLTIFGLLFFLATRLSHWPTYSRGLSIVGWCVVSVWAPLMLKYWARREAALVHDWGLRGVPRGDIENTNAEFKVTRKDRRTGEEVRRYDPRRNRLKIMLCTIPILLINTAVMVLVIWPFAQWNVFTRMSPLCECCEWHMRVGGPLMTENSSSTSASGRYTWTETGLAALASETLPASCEYLSPAIYLQEPPSRCSGFGNCFASRGAHFGTDRWLNLAVQGLILGIIVGAGQLRFVASFTDWLTMREHWPTMHEVEQHVVRKQVLYSWVNIYFWFFMMAFVYVPFGEGIQDILQNMKWGGFVPLYGWLPSTLNIDEVIVTPLVVMQMTNLVFETLVPYLRMKPARHVPQRRYPSADYKTEVLAYGGSGDDVVVGNISSGKRVDEGAKEAKASETRPGELLSGDLAASDATIGSINSSNEKVGIHIGPAGEAATDEPELQADASTQHLFQDTFKPRPGIAAEVNLQLRVSMHLNKQVRIIPQTDDMNRLDAEEIVHQARREVFNPRTDYLDVLIQFGFILMFTSAWVLVPFIAVFNNILEVRTDVFKVLRTQRRCDPVEDQGIGEWSNALLQTVYLALPVAAGLFVLSTGELDRWTFKRCALVDDSLYHGPNFDCFSSWGVRFLVGVFLERLGAMVVTVIQRGIDDTHSTLQAELADEEVRRRRRMQDIMLPELPAGLSDDLKVVFEEFDTDHNGVLSNVELQQLFEILIGTTLPQHHMELLLSFVDVDGSETASFAEFALALQRAQDDFVLSQVLKLTNLAGSTRELAKDVRNGEVSSLRDARRVAGLKSPTVSPRSRTSSSRTSTPRRK